ncbi:MAG: hypothetical protein IJI66_07595 [Erysipelotrichaceae bacterium]|nr:hypothetical protein [Erysipelotrichaceae bacterium]
MARPKKDYKPLNIKMDAELYDLLSDYCEEKGQTKTMAIERIIGQFLSEHNDEKMKKVSI